MPQLTKPETDKPDKTAPAKKAVAKKAVAKKAPPKPPSKSVAPAAAPKVRVFEPDFSKLQPLADKEDFFRVVVYGDAGVGKTTLAAQMAARGRVVFADCENSVRKGALSRIGIDTNNLFVWPDWSYDGIEQMVVTVKASLEDDPGSIFAVVVDTATNMVQKWLEDTVADALKRPSVLRKHPDREMWDVFQEDYGVVTEKFRSLILRRLYALPCHVLVLAHTRRGESETGRVRVGPGLSPAMQASLMTLSDAVLFMSKDDEDNRTILTAPRGQIEAKDRLGILELVEETPNILDILDRLAGQERAIDAETE